MVYEHVIIALGGSNFNGRLQKALELYQDDPNAALIISGTAIDDPQRYVQPGKGLDSVLNERESINTEENAIFSLNKLKRELPTVKHVTIVSDYAHKPRAELYFKKYGGRDYEIDFSGVKTEDGGKRILYEVIGLPMALLPYEFHKKLTKKIRAMRNGRQ